jgi:hypothetical protein
MHFIHLGLLVLSAFLLNACGDEAQEQSTTKLVSQSEVENGVVQKIPAEPTNSVAGGVTVRILPEAPTSTGCLQAVIQGVPGRSAVIWKVNSEVVSSGTDTQLCSENYKRDDSVAVEVGTNDQGAQASVSIGNSPPRVVDISSSPAEIFAGTDITVSPVVEDADGDSVDFTYQWLVNDEIDPVLTEATLPGDKFTKGDTIQVLIVPNDFYDDGPTYESYAQKIPNAAPSITSLPPQGITSLDYRYQVVVSDPDDTQFTYRLDEAPEGMTIDATSGLIQWSLVEAAPGDHTIAIIVTDPDGAEVSQEYNLTLSASE